MLILGERVLWRGDLLVDLLFQITQLFLLVGNLVDKLLALALHLVSCVLDWVELIEHSAQLRENI